MQEILLGSNKNSKHATSYKTLKELNNLLAPQIESHLIDQASDLCNAAGKALAKTGGRHGKLFKLAGSLVKMTGTGGKIALQSASKVSKLPIAPAAGVALKLYQTEEMHNSGSTKYNDLITNGITLIKDIIETACSLCVQATQSLFDALFTAAPQQDMMQGEDVYNIPHDSPSFEDESAEIAGNDIEQFFDIYCP